MNINLFGGRPFLVGLTTVAVQTGAFEGRLVVCTLTKDCVREGRRRIPSSTTCGTVHDTDLATDREGDYSVRLPHGWKARILVEFADDWLCISVWGSKAKKPRFVEGNERALFTLPRRLVHAP